MMTGQKQKQYLCYISLFILLFVSAGCRELLHPEGPETPSVPAAPVGVGVELVPPTSVRVFWDAVPDATQYEVYDEISSRMTTYTSLLISEYKENTSYRFTVKAGNATGWSVPSEAVSITTSVSAAIPAAPSGVTATALSTSEIIVSWQPSAGATKYQVHDGTKDYDTDKAYYTVQGLSESATYQFTVKAGNDAGWSAGSTPPASAATLSSTPQGTAPAAPTGVTATALASGEVLVTWAAAAEAETYLVSYGEAEDATTVFGASTLENSATISGLSPTTVYYFSVKAGNTSGWSDASDPASATTLATPEAPEPPATPQDITALALSESSISLSWNSVEGAVSYTVYRSLTESSGFTGIGTSGAASYTDTGLSASTTYYYKVRASGELNTESALSASIPATTLAAGSKGKPPAPQGVSATALSADSIRISWNVTAAAASYKIYRSGSEDGTYAVVGASATTSYANANLEASTTFYYKVSAVGSGGEGPQSAAVFATTLAMPPAIPQDLNATALSPDSIKITWTAVAKAASYKIYRSETADGLYADIDSGDSTNYTDTGLSAATAYYYKASALGSDGAESALSAMASATTPALPPGTPQGLNAVASAPGSITLSWQPVAEAVDYRIYRAESEAGSYAALHVTSATEHTDLGLPISTQYYYRVSGINADGVEGEQSAAASATTEAAVLVPHTNIADALTWLNSNVKSYGSYIIRLDSSSPIAPKTFSYTGKDHITITLEGTGGANRVISLNASGTLFAIESGVTLILNDKITLSGRSNNNASLVKVNSGGTLIMNEGSKITGNTVANSSSSSVASYGGGVYVNSGAFTMNGGTISGNTTSASHTYSYSDSYYSYSYGGGVYVDSGAFTMNNGTISGNTASSSSASSSTNASSYSCGGGVYINSGVSFAMNGGTISGNTAAASTYSSAYGGGIYINSGASFTMDNGTISGNTVSTTATSYYAQGGGVFVGSNATCTMASGAITGNTASAASNNSRGGGVYITNTGLFTMNGGAMGENTADYGGGVSVNTTGLFTKAASGGIIYGSNGGTNKNTATGGDSNGHAVYISGDTAKKRNSTAGAATELDSTTPGSAGGWE